MKDYKRCDLFYHKFLEITEKFELCNSERELSKNTKKHSSHLFYLIQIFLMIINDLFHLTL